MKPLVALLLPLVLAVPGRAQWQYPPTRTVDASDTYFGRTYQDPYRWLEDLKAPEVGDWFRTQGRFTDDLLAKIPGRAALVREWAALDKLKPAKYSCLSLENGRIFYKKTRGGENVGQLYFRQGWTGTEQPLFDPASYKAGVATTIGDALPSMDGRYVALALTANGAEFGDIRILDVARRTLLPECIQASYGPSGWAPDSRSFFYDAGKVADLKSLDVELDRKTLVHRLGTPVSADIDIFSDQSNPELGIAPRQMPSAWFDPALPGYLLGSVTTVQNEMCVFRAPLAQLAGGKLAWEPLCRTSDNLVRGLVFHQGQAYAVTHARAANYRVVRTRALQPDWEHAETVIPEGPCPIQYIASSRDFLFVVSSNGVVGSILKYEFATGKSTRLELPGIPTGTLDIDCPDLHSNRCVLSVTSWIQPTTLYDLDADKDTFTKSCFNSDVCYPGFERLVTEEVEVPSHDGTQVPLSIIHLKGLPLDGNHSCILDGYGAYGTSCTPCFNVMRSLALRGVVLAYAHPRGGSEKGEAWYKGGFKTTKPNTWKDFIACAQYLVAQGYTRPQRLAGMGTSAGGILISRAVTERPDLFAAAVCNVGCANAMRSEFSPNGPVNIPEFGTVKDPVECQALYEMDGLQHVQPGVCYPAIMGVAGWNDPRVPAWEPGKFVAALQKASGSGKPVLMKVNFDNGHFTEDKTVTFTNFAGQFAFLLWQTGHPEFQPVN
jgi:prolyl oligopeptidase